MRWSASSTRMVCSFIRWTFTQATKVLPAEESGQWMGRFSYMPLWTSLKKSRASQSRRLRLVPIAGPCWAQAVCSGAAAGWPRPSRRSSASSVVSRKRMPCGSACERSAVAGLEDTLCGAASRPEAAESDAKGGAQVVGGGLGVELFDVIGERRALRAVDGGAGGVLGVAPGRGAGTAELDGGLTVGFVDSKGLFDDAEDRCCVFDFEDRKSLNVGNLEVDAWVQRAQRWSAPQPSSSDRIAASDAVRKGCRPHVVKNTRKAVRSRGEGGPDAAYAIPSRKNSDGSRKRTVPGLQYAPEHSQLQPLRSPM